VNTKMSYVSFVIASLVTGAAYAQNAANDQARDVNQQQRIEQGLQSGQLSTKEAGSLERQEQHIDHMQAKDLRNGSISPAEQARLNAAQNKVSGEIHADKTNGIKGNPNSASSERMQADVQRNINQQERIKNGISNGSLTNKEVGSLERGQAHVAGREANAARNGHVSAAEQSRIQGAENHQSNRIYNKKHNDRVRK
jgi:hypothetical protein